MAVFGNGGSAEHVNQRIRAAKNAHRSLQAAGLHANGLDPLATMHVYSLGVQPCLNYGAHAIDLSTTELRALDTTHSNLIKWSLGCLSFVDPPPSTSSWRSKNTSYERPPVGQFAQTVPGRLVCSQHILLVAVT